MLIGHMGSIISRIFLRVLYQVKQVPVILVMYNR